jgi:hypothetical protein
MSRYGSRTFAYTTSFVYDSSVVEAFTGKLVGTEVYINAIDNYRYGFKQTFAIVEHMREIHGAKVYYVNNNINYLNITFFDDSVFDKQEI